MYFFSWWPNFNHPFDWAWVLYHTDAGGSAGGNAGLYSNEEADGLIDGMWNAPIDADLARRGPSTGFDLAFTCLSGQITGAFPQLGVAFPDLTGGTAGTRDGGSHLGAEPGENLGGGHRRLP